MAGASMANAPKLIHVVFTFEFLVSMDLLFIQIE